MAFANSLHNCNFVYSVTRFLSKGTIYESFIAGSGA